MLLGSVFMGMVLVDGVMWLGLNEFLIMKLVEMVMLFLGMVSWV